MSQGQSRYLRVHQGISHFARVGVSVSPVEGINAVECAATAIAGNYADWRAGAVAGAHHALRVAARQGWRVVVELIEGTEADTNSTAVGAASAYAVWEAVDYAPSASEAAHVERAVRASRKRGWDAVADFGP